jgi:IS605 OrfB family transposase
MLVTGTTALYHPIYKFYKKKLKNLYYDLKEKEELLDKCLDKEKKKDIKKEILDLKSFTQIVKLDKEYSVKDLEKKRNPLVSNWELFTPKDIRDCVVKQLVSNHKSADTNFKNGNIPYYEMKYKKKTAPKQSFELTSKLIRMKDGKIQIAPDSFTKEEKLFTLSKSNTKKYKNLKIKHNCDVVREKGEYWLHVPIPVVKTCNLKDTNSFSGVDPGLRTFATTFNGKDGSSVEYKQKQNLLDKLNDKIKFLKKKRLKILPFNYLFKSKYKKKQFNKVEKKKINLVDALHWNVINDMLKRNDIVYFGDIKSHDIVKDGKNRKNNQTFNDLKFYKFKQRLIYKASTMKNKVVKLVNESYTSQGCSSCGKLYNIGSSKFYECKRCGLQSDRDTNSAKNILMKGLLL